MSDITKSGMSACPAGTASSCPLGSAVIHRSRSTPGCLSCNPTLLCLHRLQRGARSTVEAAASVHAHMHATQLLDLHSHCSSFALQGKVSYSPGMHAVDLPAGLLNLPDPSALCARLLLGRCAGGCGMLLLVLS